MIKTKKNRVALSVGRRVVGTVHSRQSLAAALHLKPREIDLLELRVDAFSSSVDELRDAAAKLKIPFILTVRSAKEGGAVKLSAGERRKLFERFLPLAAAIDVELSSTRELADVLTLARETHTQLILSHHDFDAMPSVKKMRELAARAAHLRADVFKVAAGANTPKDLATLLEFLIGKSPLPLSVMGMGPFGKMSRLLAATCGSVLNYGFLDAANASGQWPAQSLKMQIAEVEASAIALTPNLQKKSR